MSVLQKAKAKARDGIRAVNAETKKQFKHIRSNKNRTDLTSSSKSTSYHYRQVNEAFKAALDDESEFYDKTFDESITNSTAQKQKVSSISDHRLTPNLFDYVEEPPIHENIPTLKDHTLSDNLFLEDVQPISADPPLPSLTCDIASNRDPLSESEQSRHDPLFEDESHHDPLFEDESHHDPLFEDGSHHDPLFENESHHDPLFDDESHHLLPESEDHHAFPSELRTHSKSVDSDNIRGAQTSSDGSKPLSSDFKRSANDDALFFGDQSTNAVSLCNSLTKSLEPHQNSHQFSAHGPPIVLSNSNDHLFEDKTDATEGDEADHFPSDVNESANHDINNHPPEIGLTLGENILVIESSQEDNLFPDSNTLVSKQYKSQDIHKENEAKPETPTKLGLSPMSLSYSQTSSLASSYEEDQFLNTPSPQTIDHSFEKTGSMLGKNAKAESVNVDTYPIEECATVDASLAPNHYNEQGVSQPPDSLFEHPLEVPLQQSAGKETHLDSGVFDQGSTSNEDELIQIQEDHFKRSSPSATNNRNFPRGTLALGKSPVRPPPFQTTPPKRNSAGRVPPQRPQLSPKLRKKLCAANPESPVKPVPKAKSWGEETSTIGQALRNKEDRLVADDLFEKDLKPTPRYSLLENPILPELDQATPSRDYNQNGHSEVKRRFWRDDSAVGNDLFLTVHYHLLLAFLLYLYYTFNSSSYLAGVLAGVLWMFLSVGSLFVYYISTIETERREKTNRQSCFVQPSEEFLRKMDVNFEKIKVYQSTQFTATMSYDPATHHPSQWLNTEIKLVDDFFLHVEIHQPSNTAPYKVSLDMRDCTISMVPEEVTRNRKRRWNKKFPICITETSKKVIFFLFSPTSRDKEDWFRRLRQASEGFTSENLMEKLNSFFGYMEDYFPSSSLTSLGKNHRGNRLSPRAFKTTNRILFSKESEEAIDENALGGINISRESGPRVSRHSKRQHSPSMIRKPSSTSLESTLRSNLDRASSKYTSVTSTTFNEAGASREFEHLFRPPKVTEDTLWLNTVAARLCWDIWHDHRWKDWVKSRIQKKLFRLKTPSFMEPLSLTDVELGNDMPVVNRLCGGPHLDLRGLWVYLDVTYEGRFVMTIKTKLKSGKREDEPGQPMSVLKSSSHSIASPNQKHARAALSHVHAAKALSSMGASVDLYDNEIDSGSDEDEGALLSHSVIDELHRQEESADRGEQPLPSNRDRLKSVVMRIGKRVANTKFVRKAVEKVSSYPLVLTVVVNRLDGVLAVNIPPPTTDTIWFGFVESPRLQLVARPKLGHREVKLSAVTQWIERKLCDLVDKKLVLPEMEDIVIPVLNSGLPEDIQKVLVTDNDQT